MARRKKGFLDDGSDSDASNESVSEDGFDSQEDGDSRAERRLFEHRHKRPRTMDRDGKAAAWEGIFGEDDNGVGRRPRGGPGRPRGGGPSSERTDWTKYVPSHVRADPDRAPTFVSTNDVPPEGSLADLTRAPLSVASDESDSESSSSDGSPSRAATPRQVGAEDEEDAPRSGLGGIGFRAASAFTPTSPAKLNEDAPVVKSAFGRAAAAAQQMHGGARSSFQSSRSTTPSTVQQTELTRAEKAHFSKITGGFGAKLLAKQGWAPGKGLGLNEDGRAVPVAVGSVMRGEGIRSGIRTEDSKREARRRGELQEEEEAKPKRGSRKPAQRAGVSRDGWQKHKKVKVKVEHKTYEQLLAEEGTDTTRPGVGLVIDARGGDVGLPPTARLHADAHQLKAVESISELSLSGWTPTLDATQLPELRHNLRLVVDVTRGDVSNLVREGKAINERRRWSTRDEERSRQRAEESSQGEYSLSVELTFAEIQALEVVQSSVDEISAISQRQVVEGSTSLLHLEESFNRLLIKHEKEYRSLGLDDVIVGAIDLVLRKPFAHWQPFDVSSDALLSILKPWKQAFNLEQETTSHSLNEASERSMTAWESLLWQRWLPKVRSAINNEWDVLDPQPAVHLIESWDSILPRFIHDNILDQLVLPKVTVAVEDWTGRPLRDGRKVSLASIIFPWLPLMGERVGDLLEAGKRRVRAVLRKWSPSDGVLSELQRWRDDVSHHGTDGADDSQIFSTHEWDKLMGDYVLGKLGACLRDDFAVNPRSQDMKPLEAMVLPWHSLIRPSNFVRLFELEFFPKWLNVLYMWLVHPAYNADEVAQWFEIWKRAFPQDLVQHRGMAHGFNTGLKLMRDAVELGSSAPSKLQKPQYTPLPSGRKSSNGSRQSSKPVQKSANQQRLPAPEDITFRTIAEEFIADHDLLLRPLGKSHPTTGKPLFRIGKTIEGKGGLVVYFSEDAVFAQVEDAVFRALSLDDMVKRAG